MLGIADFKINFCKNFRNANIREFVDSILVDVIENISNANLSLQTLYSVGKYVLLRFLGAIGVSHIPSIAEGLKYLEKTKNNMENVFYKII